MTASTRPTPAPARLLAQGVLVGAAGGAALALLCAVLLTASTFWDDGGPHLEAGLVVAVLLVPSGVVAGVLLGAVVGAVVGAVLAAVRHVSADA